LIVVVPTGKTFPDGTPVREIAPTPGQLSVAEALPMVASLTTVPQDVAPAPVYAVTFAGGVITGTVLSITVTVCVAEALLPWASVTE
jgi:hypothetical protein